jgi:peptidyl-prolyl cis-trans isomerase B (cyclophilin B)
MKIALIALLMVLILSPGVSAQGQPKVQITTNMGEIIVELDAAKAPQTVTNFLAYTQEKHYDNTIFHRVIKGFMIQGGGMTAEMNAKTTRKPVPNEADNGLKNVTGTIAMARTSDPHSATSQFFINTQDNAFLDHKAKSAQGWGYCVFGKVVKGMEVVRAIEAVETTNRAGHGDVPVEPMIIKSMQLLPTK